MKQTIKKINELVYQEDYAYCETDQVNLEMLLVALDKKRYSFHIAKHDTCIRLSDIWDNKIVWQLNKTLTEQSKETQETIKNLFE